MIRSGRLSRAALVLGLLGAVPSMAAAAPAITVEVFVGDSCMTGTGPSNTAHVVTLRTPGGTVRGSFRTTSDEAGFWGGCFPFATNVSINGGDRLRIVAGSLARSLTVPRLEPRTNRVTDVISGIARPGATVDIVVEHRASFRQASSHEFAVRADAEGRFRVDTTSRVDVLGNDFVVVLYEDGPDAFGALAVAPNMVVGNGSNTVTGSVNNGTDLTLWLRNASGVNKAVVTAGPIMFGFFQVSMFRSDGRAAYAEPGDRLIGSFSSDARVRIPSSFLRGDAGTDVIEGRCMANASYELVADSLVGRFERFTGTTDAEGRVRRDVTSRMNLRRGYELQLTCLYPTGDTWMRTGIVR